MIKLALHSVSYSGTWGGQAVLPIEKILSKAKKFGYDGVELMAKRPHLSPLDFDRGKREELRDLLESEGLEVAAIAGYNDFAHPQADLREKELFFLKETISMAGDLGAKIVRVFASGMGDMHSGAPSDEQWIWVKDGLEEAAEFAEKNGVILGLQNHSPIMQSYKNVLDMVKEVGMDSLKITLDAPLLDWAAEPIYESVLEVGGLMVHSHTSDHVERAGPLKHVPGGMIRPISYRAVPLGEGQVDLRTFVKALKEIGYDGYLSYEVCGPVAGGGGEENLDKCVKKALDYMKGLLLIGTV